MASTHLKALKGLRRPRSMVDITRPVRKSGNSLRCVSHRCENTWRRTHLIS